MDYLFNPSLQAINNREAIAKSECANSTGVLLSWQGLSVGHMLEHHKNEKTLHHSYPNKL